MRQYIPKVGELVKMQRWNDYATRDISIWAWLRVAEIAGNSVRVYHSPHPMDASKDIGPFFIPLDSIQAPLGWEPVYTIYCKPEQTETVISWFKRGIAVRCNLAMDSNAGSTFQPLDNSPQPDWKHPSITEAILPENCPSVFRIVSVIEEEINSYINPEHPKLREMDKTKRAKTIQAMEKEGWKVKYMPYAGGFWVRRKETVIHDIL